MAGDTRSRRAWCGWVGLREIGSQAVFPGHGRCQTDVAGDAAAVGRACHGAELQEGGQSYHMSLLGSAASLAQEMGHYQPD